MKDPRRLLEGDATPEQHELLSAGALEEPPADGRARLLSALGVTAPVTTAPGPSQPPGPGDFGHIGGAGGEATAGGGLAATGGAVGAAGAAKLALLVLGGAALLVTGVMLWSPAGTDHGGTTNDTDATRLASGDVKEKARSPVHADADADADGSKSMIPLDHPTGGREPTGLLALEIEALERARSQLAHGDGRAALATLQRYARSHPSGALAQEADVLRVEAHLLAGEADAALQLARRLLERHDDSPHRTRLQALARQASAHPEP